MASRSLGTLTVDLIAKIGGFTQGMTQAERIADRKGREIERGMKARAKAIDGAFASMANSLKVGMLGLSASAAAGTAVMVSITKGVMEAADQVTRFAALSNTSSETFQRLAFGANTVGISAEKLADIFKDVQDKAGDFAQTGGGGMADFFENIAPKVGVSIDQFRRLSGPEALQLYVSSLEKANLSQQDMVFYMEAVASDSTQLLPLLQNNGRAWRDLGDEAQKYGAIINDEVLAASKAYKEEAAKLEAAMQGVRNEMATQLLPALSEFNRMMTDPATLQAIRDMTGLLGEFARAALEAKQIISGSSLWGWLQVGKDDADDVDGAIAETEAKIKSLQATVASMSRPLHKFWNADDIVIAQGQIATLQSKLQALYAKRDKRSADVVRDLEALGRVGLDPYSVPTPATLSPAGGGGGGKSKGGKSQAEKDAEAAERFLQSMRDQVQRSQERTAWEQLHYDIQAKGLKLSQDQLNQAQGIATVLDMAREAEQARSAEIDRQNTLFALQERLMTAQQRHQLEMLTYGMGDQAAQELRERLALQEQQQAELRKMQHEHGQELRQAESEAQKQHLQTMFDERYRLTQEAFAEELRLYDEATKQKQAKEKDWVSGVQSGFATYAREAGNAYEQSKRVAQNAFGGMADAMTGLAIKGKADFSGLATSVISDIIRMQMQAAISGLFSNVLGGVFGGISGGMAADRAAVYASGGYTGPGGVYEPAGIVHKGEGVLSQRDMRALGGPAAFEQFRASLHRGYADGGVAGRASRVASTLSSGAGISISIINKSGQPLQAESASMRRGAGGELIIEAVVQQAVSTVASQIAGDHGPVAQAMRQRSRIGA